MPRQHRADGDERRLDGIAGWLLIPAIGLIGAPVIRSVDLFFAWQLMWRSRLVLDERPVLAALVIVDLAMIVFTVIVAVHFFGKHRSTRVLFPILLLVNVYVSLLSACSIAITYQTTVTLDGRQFGGALLYAMIWIPYFLLSRRVRQTFYYPELPREAGIDLERRAIQHKWRIWKTAGWVATIVTVSVFILALAQKSPGRVHGRYHEVLVFAPLLSGILSFISVVAIGKLGGGLFHWFVSYPHLGWKRLVSPAEIVRHLGRK